MKDVAVKCVINRPADEVFGFIVNPANTVKWVEGVVVEYIHE